MRHLLLTVLFLVAASGVSPAAAIAGKWTTIENIDDPKVQGLGSWAVDQHNAQGDNLVFEGVYGGETLAEEAGTQYRLRLRAGDGHAVNNFEATVFGKDFQGRLLADFERIP